MDKTSVSSVNGYATFNSLYVAGDPGSYTMYFASDGVGSCNQALTVNASELKIKEDHKEDRLQIVPRPAAIVIQIPATSPSVEGVPFATQPRLRFVNSSGGTVPVTGFVVNASLGGATTAVLQPPVSCVGVSILGYVFFSGLYVSGDPGTYQLTFTNVDVGYVTQRLDITENLADVKPDGLTLTRMVSSPTPSGQPFATQPQVRLTHHGQLARVDGVEVVVSISNPTGATGMLCGSHSGRSHLGVVDFPALNIVGDASEEYVLTFTAAGIGSTMQAHVAVTAS